MDNITQNMDRLFELLEQIKAIPDHEYCQLEFDEAEVGRVTHPIKETLYLEDEDQIITDEISWCNTEDGVQLMERYLAQHRSKFRFWVEKSGDHWRVWDSQKERVPVLHGKECIFRELSRARKNCNFHNNLEASFQKVSRKLSSMSPQEIEEIMGKTGG